MSLHKDKQHRENENNETENLAKDISYCCTECKFETKEEKHLTSHISHTHGTLTFSCKECKFITNTKQKLGKHEKNEHTLMECDICYFSTISKSELDHHIENIHNKMFNCDQCKFEATSKKGLQNHKKMVHEDKLNFKCKNCHYETILEHNLIEHFNNKHKNEVDQPPPRDIPCIYWNRGNCSYGMKCKFPHEEIPACYDQDRCKDNKCPWYHHDKSLNTFLGRVTKRALNRKF